MPQAIRSTAGRRHDFKGLDDWIEVFRAGSHTDSKGRSCSFSEADLDQMVANVSLGKPPAVLGHPQHDDPAYGWAELKRDGGSLFARFSDVNPAFESGVVSGAYRNRSVSVVNDTQHGWRVRHIGWLGAAPPAVDGLKPVQFSADDGADVHEFDAGEIWPSVWALGDIAGTFRRIREWLIGDRGQDVADHVVPDYVITSITDQAAALRSEAVREQAEDAAETAPAFTAPPGAQHMPSLTQADLDRVATETEARVRAEIAASQDAEFAAAQLRVQQLEAERRAERIATQVASLVATGHITPAERDAGLAEFLGATDGAAEFAFTAAGTQASKSPQQWFLDFVAARGPVVKLGERTEEQEAPAVDMTDAHAIARAAQDFQAAEAKSGRTVSIESAVAHVTQRGSAR